MAVSMLAWPVMTIASISGATCLSCSRTSIPVMPGMRKSRMAASKVAFSKALTAALPSGQTVTSCPRRGNSERINSCSDFSSSANRMRKLLCGVAKRFLLDDFGARQECLAHWGMLKREAGREGASLIQTRAEGVDLSSVLTNDPMADGQTQPGSFAGAAACEERLENILQGFGRHSAAGIAKLHLRHAVALAKRDRQGAALVHAVQGVHDQVEHDRLDFLGIDPGADMRRRLEDDFLALAVGQMLNHIEDCLNELDQIGRLTAPLAAAAELEQALRDRLAAKRLLLDHLQILGNQFPIVVSI